jgi:hypothetical protein
VFSKEQFENYRKMGKEYQRQKEKETKGKRYTTANGKEIACLQCKNIHFHKGRALLNTRGMSFLGLDWLDEAAVILICTDCGFIHWFNRDVIPG